MKKLYLYEKKYDKLAGRDIVLEIEHTIIFVKVFVK